MHGMMVGFGLAFAVAGLVAITGLTARLSRRCDLYAASPALLLAVDPHYAVVATNGIESSMFLAGVAAATWAVLAAVEDETRAARMSAALSAAALPLIRPEGLGVVALLGAFALWRRPRRGAEILGTAAATALALFAWRWATYGAWVPNTAVAKAHKSVTDQFRFDLAYLAHDWPWWMAVALLPLTLFLAPTPARALTVAVAGLVALVAFQVDMWMPGGRLLLPAVALALAVAASAVADRSPRTRRIAAVVGVASLVPILFGPLPRSVFAYDRNHTALPGNDAQRAAEHLARHLPSGAVAAMRDGGVFAYFVGPHVSVAETHPRALTRPHPDGADADWSVYTPVNPEVVVATLAREHGDQSAYGPDRRVLARRTAPYVYLGRVHQHHHRYYDVYVRADLDVPPLPPAIVTNREGPS
jgi:hypothetical protein